MLTSDATVSDHLTRFLKHFKTSLHSHICFVESLLGKSSDDEKCRKAQEVYDKQYKVDEEASQIALCKDNLKIVERFCLRINEYVEYRLSKAKIEDRQIFSEFEALKTALYSIFFHLNKEIASLNLSGIVTKVSEIQNKHSIKIFERLLSLSMQSQLPPQIQNTLKSMIKTKMLKKINFARNLHQSELNEASYQSTKMQKMGDFIKEKAGIKPILRPRRVTLQASINQNSKSCFEADYVEQVKTASRIRTKITDISAYSVSPSIHYSKEKSVFLSRYPNIEANKNLQGAMDFELNFEPTKERYEIMKQLVDLNKKNQALIRKFTKKCEKKKKKLSSVSSTSDAKLGHSEKIVGHKRSNTIEQEPRLKQEAKKKTSILPMIKKKSKV